MNARKAYAVGSDSGWPSRGAGAGQQECGRGAYGRQTLLAQLRSAQPGGQTGYRYRPRHFHRDPKTMCSYAPVIP